MTLKPIICPSLLSSDLSDLARECQKILKIGGDYLHLDVMDGHFVDNLTFGPPVIKNLRKSSKGYFDCHLMIENPGKWVKRYKEAGANSITFHVEACESLEEVSKILKEIKSMGIKSGISIKPKTEVSEELMKLIEDSKVDMVLGFGGQSLIESTLSKIETLRKKFPNLNIQADGGIDLKTIEKVAKAGANVIVSGSGIFKSKNMKKTIKSLREVVKKYC